MKTEKYRQAWRSVIEELKLTSEYAGLGWFDQDGNLLASNQTMCAFLGTTPEQDNPVYQLINPDFEKIKTMDTGRDLIFDGLLTIGNYTDVSFVFNAKIFKRDNVYLVFAEADAANLFEKNKKMSRLNQEVNNLQRQLLKEKTKLEHTLNELKETQQMLIHSEKMNALGQMVAGVAHEINNPVAFVTNNLYELERLAVEHIEAFKELEDAFQREEKISVREIIQNIYKKYDIEFLREDITEIFNESKSGVTRVKKIVENLRKFSRLDESEIKHIDLIENLKTTFSIIQSEIDKKNITFSFHSDQKVMTDCFPGQLNQAILNILMNAIQAVDKGGTVAMKVQQTDKETIISIEDNGCGISTDEKEKIFNPFFTTKPVGSGTGLGLSISYKIITDLHKGKINVESEKEKGSRFIVSIPKHI